MSHISTIIFIGIHKINEGTHAAKKNLSGVFEMNAWPIHQENLTVEAQETNLGES